MTFEESRENFLESQFTPLEIAELKDRGLFEEYVKGRISINTIYAEMREQGI